MKKILLVLLILYNINIGYAQYNIDSVLNSIIPEDSIVFKVNKKTIKFYKKSILKHKIYKLRITIINNTTDTLLFCNLKQYKVGKLALKLNNCDKYPFSTAVCCFIRDYSGFNVNFSGALLSDYFDIGFVEHLKHRRIERFQRWPYLQGNLITDIFDELNNKQPKYDWTNDMQAKYDWLNNNSLSLVLLPGQKKRFYIKTIITGYHFNETQYKLCFIYYSAPFINLSKESMSKTNENFKKTGAKQFIGMLKSNDIIIKTKTKNNN